MASSPSYNPLPTTEALEWPAGRRPSGLKYLQRMSVLLLALSTVNLGLQVYVIVSGVSSSGGHGASLKIPSQALWASAVAFSTSLYIVALSSFCCRGGKRSTKLHLMLSGIALFFTFVVLVGGVVISSATTRNLQTAKSASSHACVYYDKTGITGKSWVHLPFGCSACTPVYSWSAREPNMCCCCYGSSHGGRDIMPFYGVDNCHDIFEYVLPVSMGSAVIHGISTVLSLIMFVTACVVGCSCTGCSTLCGQFSEEDDATAGRARQPRQAQVTYSARPVPVLVSSAPGGVTASLGPFRFSSSASTSSAATRITATVPPSYAEAMATKS
eukprot:scpid73919/ scgid1297/ 